MKLSEWSEKFFKWLDGDYYVMSHILDGSHEPDESHEKVKHSRKEQIEKVKSSDYSRRMIRAEQKGLYGIYLVVAVVSCIALIGVLLFTVSLLPRYGQENPRAVEVSDRYIEKGIEETGAVNVVSGMILDYRAFDTLGESHVLFTALICVMVLLRKDRKNMDPHYEDYYQIQSDSYFALSEDSIMRKVGMVILPSIFMFGLYMLLNGQNGPGGGFSGGAVMGAGMIIFAAAYGFDRVDRFFTVKVSMLITFISLTFYSFAKSYVFFMGANHLENHIPKGVPGAILSGGLILPLDMAVGFVVACTMFGFFSLFWRGSIGRDEFRQ